METWLQILTTIQIISFCRVKLLKDAPYSQAEADAAAGLQKADTKPKKKEVAMDTTEA